MLLSAGRFAVYLAEANVFNLLVPRFGDLGSRKNREMLLTSWLDSKLFKASGLNADPISTRILNECQNGGDFLRILMGEICRTQGASRWAENSPEGMLYLPLIKSLIPDALFIHIIRDGRDVATSLARLRYVRAFPWEDRHSPIGCGIYWEWMIQHGQQFGHTVPGDYLEVHFERLLADPQIILGEIGEFIDQPLDYEVIQRAAYGSLSKPNTSFKQEAGKAEFNPVGRWKKSFSEDQLLKFERILGHTLTQLGYELATDGAAQGLDLSLHATRLLHRFYFAAKFQFKNSRIVRMLRPPMSTADLDEIVLADDHPPRLNQPSTTV